MLLRSATAGASAGAPLAADLANLGISATASLSPNVLIVGDGDLSYSLALRRCGCLPAGTRLCCTTLDSAAQLQARYPDTAEPNAVDLRSGGDVVWGGVDGTDLCTTMPANADAGTLRFSRVVWLFPHLCGKSKIHKHRELLCGFFASAAPRLVDDGEVWVALTAGQGGTGAESVSPPRVWGDTWQVTECAARAGLVLRVVHAADVALDTLAGEGYRCRGFHHSDRGFVRRGALVHVLGRPLPGRVVAWAKQWRHDISFWIDPAGFGDGNAFVALAVDVAEEAGGVAVAVALVDEYAEPSTGRVARTYSLRFTATWTALTKEEANELARRIKTKAQLMGMEARSY